MKIVDEAEEKVAEAAPKAFDALLDIKYLLIIIPIACALLGLASQAVTTERNIGLIKFKLGTFATPDQPNSVPLAGVNQLKARLKQDARDMRDEYPRSAMMKILVEGDVVTITGTAKGDEQTKQYLSALAQMEIDFQNNRLDKLKKVQTQRMTTLQNNLEKFIGQRDTLQDQFKKADNPIAMLSPATGH
jgi:hypothetical protein